MEDTNSLGSPIRFGIFEVDLQAGELRRNGSKIKLQEQPFQVLVRLLERPNEVVTREELQKELWPADTFVDFDRGLNRAINKLREALVDDADNPRFVETLPRRGYRFLAPVEKAGTRELEGAGRDQIAIPQDHPYEMEDIVSSVAVPRRQVLPWAVAGALAAIAVIASWGPWRAPRTVADRPFLQLDLDVGPDEFSQPAISPDGMRIVFVSKGSLAIRRFDQANNAPIARTDGASFPFFSPDGGWVAFFSHGKLQKIAVDGGAPVTLCDALSPGGGTWGDDDNIVAAMNRTGELSRVPAAGGTPRPFTDSKGDLASTPIHLWPQALPGGKGILFGAANGSWQGSLRVLTPHNGLKTLVENSTHGRYIAGGYLIYHQRGTLFAAPMDPRRLELTGPAMPLVDGVSYRGTRADFDLSASGTLIYYRSTVGTKVIPSWLSSSGKIEPLPRDTAGPVRSRGGKTKPLDL